MVTDTDNTTQNNGLLSGCQSCLLALLSFGSEFAHGSFEQRDCKNASFFVLVQLPNEKTNTRVM